MLSELCAKSIVEPCRWWVKVKLDKCIVCMPRATIAIALCLIVLLPFFATFASKPECVGRGCVGGCYSFLSENRDLRWWTSGFFCCGGQVAFKRNLTYLSRKNFQIILRCAMWDNFFVFVFYFIYKSVHWNCSEVFSFKSNCIENIVLLQKWYKNAKLHWTWIVGWIVIVSNCITKWI